MNALLKIDKEIQASRVSSYSQSSDPHRQLERIRNSFLEGQRLIKIAGAMKLTKTNRAPSEVLLLNDIDLQREVVRWIDARTTQQTIIARYRDFDPQLQTKDLPTHFAARVLTGLGSVSSGQNIFLFFPECLGIKGQKPADFFGIELIDVWNNVFQKAVFPCVRTLFTPDSQIEALSILGPNIEKTIYLASIFHELGHQAGQWRVSPRPDPKLQISQFYLDVFGELATDSLLVRSLSEFPEIAYFVMLQRLFWFGRRGFRDNPQSAWINLDNDSWLSALVWNRMTKQAALKPQGDRWTVDFECLKQVFYNIVNDVENLGREVLHQRTQALQDECALEFMKQEVQWDVQHGFVLPPDMREAFRRCVHIEEIPYFHPLTEMIFEGDFNA